MKNTLITLVSVATLAISANAQTYATNVVSFTSGPDNSTVNDPLEALGSPNWNSVDDDGFVSIGTLGSLTLSFGTSFSSDGTSADDIMLHEIGVSVERSTVEVSIDGATFFTVGTHGGTTAGMDLDAIGLTQDYNYLRITDVAGDADYAPFAGADIDAVAVNLQAVPEPSSTALLGLGALGLLVRRKR